ncbi:transglutaminase-like domain-containing protein [Dokdonella sp.]|uniref:transglutaminase-like domain-containing protein n=1 Tax=Dokdonella sp. TaxID=2291710 RepID=UPI001B09D889|nr:transglutaminase-like domain-containing protein [Dokdonella sp.]MBO9662514.1 transglutaminase domain-containing protein [Dokdonella sp.]
MRRLLLAVLFALPSLAGAAPPQDQWFTVLLDGRKIGTFESRREVRGGEVVTMQKLDLVLDRAGTQVTMSSAETSTETEDGKPLGFRSVSQLSGSETVLEGTLRGDTLRLVSSNGGETQKRTLPWPKGALLPEGVRLAGVRAGLAPGTRYKALSFQPSSADAAEITSVVGAKEDVDLPTGRRSLSPVEQTLAFPGAPMKTRAWVDADQTVYKLAMPVMGVELVLLACDRTCATAPNQGSDVFERTLVDSPRALTPAGLAGTMRYTLAPRESGKPLTLPDTDEQSVERRGDELLVTVRRKAVARGEAKPDRDDYQPNDWLQSKSPELVKLARRAVGTKRDPLAQMHAVETFVRGFIRNKSLGVGYASALEVARKPEGDCTEHAVLVAALGRTLGLATRVVDGLAYAPGFAGKEQVFVPHAWAQAWIDGRWQSFDAALPGFDAGHIALSVGDGDPWRFYAGLDMLGRIELREAEALTP